MIKFQTPLTLILGHNGAGKTSIIECLKAMTTGTFPPGTDRGRTFLLDPKITNKGETLGKIKLVFQAINGKAIYAERSWKVYKTKD